jgi:peptide chain release factor 1
MLDKLAGVEARYEELETLLADPAVMADYEKVAEYAKERSDIHDIVMTYREYQKQINDLEGAKELAYGNDEEMAEMAKLEVDELSISTEQLYESLKSMLLPKDPRDGKNVIMEIRAGTGGDEAGLFSGDLLRMYLRYAEVKRWKTEVINQNESGGNVIKSVTLMIQGKDVFSRLKYESGVHRVQRVPATEAQGRIHTSTATVAVLAEMDEVEVNLDMNDVRVDVFRSQGAGGQSVNTTDSAVRMTHIPSGIVVEMQDERKQLQNRIRAKQVLIARLYEMEMEKQRSEYEAERRGQIGGAERSEKIRTYNYPQGRVTDHRIGFSSYNLPAVMDGNIDDFIDQLATRAQAEQLSAGGGDDDE